MTPEQILAGQARASARRRPLEGIWQDCYDHALPAPHAAPLFDATAADAAEQLAASLLAELAPPWSRWFGLAPARRVADGADAQAAARLLEAAAETLQGHLDRSNFALELHQAFLELVVTGTAVLLAEEAPPGEASALRFAAVPLREAVLEEGASGRLDTVYRVLRLTPAEILARWPAAPLAPPRPEETSAPLRVVEAVWPDARAGHRHAVVLDSGEAPPALLAEGRFAENPFIAFRWLKVPGETYGRGPVAKALPDIRTANKVVELILKNASIAATGIWQAEDDGVLNPATVRLVPGAIIPKAQGSAGLTPLAAPGNFDVSQIVLQDLRARIRGALLADRIAASDKVGMTATEVTARSAISVRLLGAIYGRLQAELLGPLVARCLAILRRRGEVPALLAGGEEARLVYASPLARVQARADAADTLLFLQAAAGLGAEAKAVLDAPAAARWLARTLGAPAEIIRPADTTNPNKE
ncbi:portal protein [Falsiroseomonas selenitidurans]|uniref:Phage tail protein n=1 Tax=Falsiroseomonas selenitidurans TaxID=2716335 RepID=A0ABX1DXC5_9PROT|nr:portal protein [Falsiroseomonas selenitidurans]NKC29431.1 phage tail protein [Falsiroseomonas selenitidurans]